MASAPWQTQGLAPVLASVRLTPLKPSPQPRVSASVLLPHLCLVESSPGVPSGASQLTLTYKTIPVTTPELRRQKSAHTTPLAITELRGIHNLPVPPNYLPPWLPSRFHGCPS